MLAIIIPFYKITFFEATLQSLENQTDKRFKVYIGDDASTEDPYSLLEKYQGKFNFKYHRFEDNLGGFSLVKQWERCISMSTSEEWIMILGDDDVLGDNVIASFYENISKIEIEKINVIRYSTQKIDYQGNVFSDVYYHPTIEKATNILFTGARSSLSEIVFKRKQIETIGFREFPLAWLSDVLAILEFSNFQTVFSINESCVSVRTSDLNISGKQDNIKQKREAYFLFHFYLLNNKQKYFTKLQMEELLSRVSRSYLNDKKQLHLFLNISKIYFCNYKFAKYFKFIKSIFLKIIKKK